MGSGTCLGQEVAHATGVLMSVACSDVDIGSFSSKTGLAQLPGQA